MSRRRVWSFAIAALGSAASDAAAAAPSESSGGERPSREVLVGAGISSMAAPRDSALELGPGLNALFYYGGRHFAGVAQVLLGRSEADAHAVTYGAYAAGYRHRFLDWHHTPFLGTGLAASSVGFSDAGHDSDGNLGFAVYGEIGAEFFRLDEIRVLLTLRVDHLLFDPLRDTNRRSAPDGSPVYDSVVTNVTPISLNLSIGWAGRPASWLMPGGSR
jgi:hypothetical protein